MVPLRWVALILALGLCALVRPPSAVSRAAPAADAATDFLLAQLPVGRAAIQDLVAALTAGDLAGARAAYARARVPWEKLEVVVDADPSLEEFDTAIDAREDDFPLGSNDPNWKGFHKIERGLWYDQQTTPLVPVAQQLLADWDAMAAQLQRLVQQGAFTPATLLDGAEDLLAEVAETKITGEEERYSKLDLLDFQANLAGAEAIYNAYQDQIAARDRGLAGEIARGFQQAKSALAPFVRSETEVTNYDQVPQDARNRIAASFRTLARALERASQLMERGS
jgi:iron uptake system component EfeO